MISSTESLADRVDLYHVLTLDFPSANAAEFASTLGFDAIAIDFEHGKPDWETAQNMVRACELSGTTAIGRIVPSAESVAACLDIGITTLQLAQVDSMEDVETVLRRTRFAPRGSRGIGRARANRFGHYPGGYTNFAGTAESVRLIVHIETLAGVENLPEIVSVDQVDVIVVGAQDLAASLGHLGDSNHAEVRSTIEQVCETVLASGKAIGMSASTPEDARAAHARGARLVLSSQARLMSTAASALLAVVSAPDPINREGASS